MADKTARIRELDDSISHYPVEAIHSYGVEFHFGKHSHVSEWR